MTSSKSFFSILWLSLFTLLFAFSQVAEAKRLGSGGSSGYNKQVAPKSFNQKSTTDSKATNAAPSAAPAGAAAAAGTTAAKSGASKWLGPLAGLAVGGLLAAMIFGDAFEGLQIMDFLLFALIAFGLFMFFKRKKRQNQEAQSAYAGYPREMPNTSTPTQPAPVQMRETQAAHVPYNPNAGGSIIGSGLSGSAPSSAAQSVTLDPDWFNEAGFLQGAKEHFIALQKAWDDADLGALRDYCTAELFQELAQQLEGVQAGENQTRVDALQVEIADKVIEDNYFIVSVRYSGFIEENADEGAHAFSEIWHIRRLQQGEGNWALAGIQQEQR
ncbi:MAG: TIM44-like domain-containing protein [Thiotrichales bacterium]|nr:TIM44-like domain-containing protein [Thiotrichales bacterium]